MAVIRVLTPDDSTEVWGLRLEALESEPEAFGASAEDHRLTDPIEVGQRQLRDSPEGNFMVGAFEDGRLVGLSGFVRNGSRKARHRGDIVAVYVTEAHRGRGLARRMLEIILERVRGYADFEIVTLGVTCADTPARRLYLSMGFKPVATFQRALKIGDTYVDENIMELDLLDAPGG